MSTTPPIAQAQNRTDAQLRLAAQARLYSDVKRDQAIRASAAVALGALAASLSLLRQGKSIGVVAGIALLFLNGLLMHRERRRAALAAAIQEDFDCLVLQLPWNDVLFRHRPTGQEIASAAARYAGERTQDWYPATGGLRRPLDVVVCQQSNVGWGAPVHRAWAWSVIAIVVAVAALQVAIWWAANLDATDGLDALVAPFLATYWEAFEAARRNFESAREKEECQQRILDDWAAALAGADLREDQCRRYQDAIAHIRRHNAQVPDWFDERLRDANERAMRTSAQDMIAQATQAGQSER